MNNVLLAELNTLFAWRRPGFSVHVGTRSAPEDVGAMEDLAGYVASACLSCKRLVYIDALQAVICRHLGPTATLGQDFEPIGHLRWAAR
jgi:hypothetical protein